MGTVDVPSTGGVYEYTEVSADLRGATGRHDVYLVLDGSLRLATFRLAP